MVQFPSAGSTASSVAPNSIESSVNSSRKTSGGDAVSGNIRPLMLSTLVSICALYLVLDASAEPKSSVTPEERSAVTRTLTPDPDRDHRVEQVLVTAPRINQPEFDLAAPQVEIALSLQPPKVKLDPPELKRQP